ncbi:MAG: hypothetical protein MZV65_48710 [Chromatiales bacterium]|nr:hypothetical protein [Chromatiales bacterium]
MRTAEKKLRGADRARGDGVAVRRADRPGDRRRPSPRRRRRRTRASWPQEFALFRDAARRLRVRASPSPTGARRRRRAKGSGGLFSITVNPYTCKGCELCVSGLRRRRAEDGARRPQESVERLRRDWNFWLDLPTTPQGVQPHRQPRREDRRAGDAAARQAQLQLDDLRRRRLPGLRREDRDPPVHRRPSRR